MDPNNTNPGLDFSYPTIGGNQPSTTPVATTAPTPVSQPQVKNLENKPDKNRYKY